MGGTQQFFPLQSLFNILTTCLWDLSLNKIALGCQRSFYKHHTTAIYWTWTMCEPKSYKGYFKRWSPVSAGNSHFLKNLNTLLSKIKFKILSFCHLRPLSISPCLFFPALFQTPAHRIPKLTHPDWTHLALPASGVLLGLSNYPFAFCHPSCTPAFCCQNPTCPWVDLKCPQPIGGSATIETEGFSPRLVVRRASWGMRWWLSACNCLFFPEIGKEVDSCETQHSREHSLGSGSVKQYYWCQLLIIFLLRF